MDKIEKERIWIISILLLVDLFLASSSILIFQAYIFCYIFLKIHRVLYFRFYILIGTYSVLDNVFIFWYTYFLTF